MLIWKWQVISVMKKLENCKTQNHNLIFIHVKVNDSFRFLYHWTAVFVSETPTFRDVYALRELVYMHFCVLFGKVAISLTIQTESVGARSKVGSFAGLVYNSGYVVTVTVMRIMFRWLAYCYRILFHLWVKVNWILRKIVCLCM